MGTVVFDFDSTLVPCESLEVALASAAHLDEASRAEIEAITRRGMEAEISFRESMEARLAIAEPRRADLLRLGDTLTDQLTAGAAGLVVDLHARGHQVWIVSGAFREVLLPVGHALGLPAERIQGIRARWDDDGLLLGLDPDDGFATSKVEGVRQLAPAWPRPAVGVGDGATDLALLDAGLVDRFVAYTEHARRTAVLARNVPAAESMRALRTVLEPLLHGDDAGETHDTDAPLPTA